MKQLSQGAGELIRFDRVRRMRILPGAIIIIILIITFTVVLVNGIGERNGETEETDATITLPESETQIADATTYEESECTTAEPETEREVMTTEEATTESLYELKDMHGDGIITSAGIVKTYDLRDFDFGVSKSDIDKGEPTVLILHTHTGEAYSESRGRSDSPESNVSAVGAGFAERLSENGICAIHCTVPFDSQTTMGAYARAAEVIENYLRIYPSIVYVVDIHRMSDSVSGKFVRTRTDKNGAAQARFIVSNSSCVPGEERNLKAALKICGMINRTSEICTPIFEGEGGYNHGLAVEYGKYMLTVEIGAVGNTLAEAKKASDYIADALSEMIYGIN